MKSEEEGGRGSYKYLQFLLSPKGPNELRNIPFSSFQSLKSISWNSKSNSAIKHRVSKELVQNSNSIFVTHWIVLFLLLVFYAFGFSTFSFQCLGHLRGTAVLIEWLYSVLSCALLLVFSGLKWLIVCNTLILKWDLVSLIIWG